jgi:hypothetical protein
MIFIDVHGTHWVARCVRQNVVVVIVDYDDDDAEIVIIIETRQRQDFDADYWSKNFTNDCTKFFVLYRNSK